MSKDNIVEGNKLIAEFMGIDLSIYKTQPKNFSTLKFTHDELQYHVSWVLLMPVVHKLHEVVNEEDQSFARLSIFELGFSTDMKVIWKNIVDAIKWYNKNKSGNKIYKQ